MRKRTLVIVFGGLTTGIGSMLWLHLGHTPPASWGFAVTLGGIVGVLAASAVSELC